MRREGRQEREERRRRPTAPMATTMVGGMVRKGVSGEAGASMPHVSDGGRGALCKKQHAM